MNKYIELLQENEYINSLTEEEVDFFLKNYQNDSMNYYKHIDFNKYINIVGKMNKSISSEKYIQSYCLYKKLNTDLDYVKLHHSGYLDDGLGGMSYCKSTKEFENFALDGFNNVFHCWEIWYGILELEPKRDIISKDWVFELDFHSRYIDNNNLQILIKSFCYLRQNNIPVVLDENNKKTIKEFLNKMQ